MSASPPSVYATVIVPTYDRASTLAESVRSIQAQTVTNLEIIISGDGVTPDVREVALGLASSDPRIVFYDWSKAPRRGSENRDRAVQAAKAERIFYNDDDDLFLPQHVEKLGPVLDEYDAVDDAVGSISLSGRVQISIANHGSGPIREALAAAKAKVIFDTHFAHRKSTYRRLRNPWLHADKPAAWNLFQAFAGDPSVRWRTLPEVSALSFHGAGRVHLTSRERRLELEDWSRKISRSFAAELGRTAQYDWYIFTLARNLSPALPLVLEQFLAACHVGLNGASADETTDLIVSIPGDRIESLRDVFALLRNELVDGRTAVELAVRLSDPLLGARPQHRRVVPFLTAALGAETAIKAVGQYHAPDAHSVEICGHLLGTLLLEQGRLAEARERIWQVLKMARHYRGDAFALAAEVARRQSIPDVALDYANSAISADRKIADAHHTAVWALLELGQRDEAQAALSRARLIFPNARFVQALESRIREGASPQVV